MPVKTSMVGHPADHPMTEFVSGRDPIHRLGLPNYWINTATLNLTIIDRIFFYKGLGPSVPFTLTYNAHSRDRGMFGHGWSFCFESYLIEDGDQVLLKKGSGQQLRFRISQSQKKGSGNMPAEAENLSQTRDRLLDYGTYYVFLPKGVHTFYRYPRAAGKKHNLLQSVSDFDGNVVSLEYLPDATLGSITDAAGRVSRFEIRGGLCTGFTLPDGRRCSFQYDTTGRLMAMTDLAGIPVRYEYSREGLLTLMEVGEDRKRTSFSYRGSALSAVTDAAGHTTTYLQNKESVRVTDPLGNSTIYESRGGKTTGITNPLGESRIFQYSGGLRVGHTDIQRGTESRLAFDGAGNPARFTGPNGEITSFVYDQHGNLVEETNPRGDRFCYVYDTRQHLTTVRSPAGSEINLSYDPKGQLVMITDQNAGATTVGYDRFGNIAEIRDPEGGRTRFSFDAAGLTLMAVTDARENTIQYEFDNNRRLTHVIYPDGTSSKNVYGCCSRLATIDENDKETRFARDPLLSILERRDGDGNVFRYQYDPCRRLIRSIDPGGRSTDFGYDRAGRLIRATYPGGESLQIEYAFGRTPGRITDENGHAVTFEHDRNGALIRETDQAGIPVSVARDVLGRIATITTGAGRQISYAYDAEGRLIEKRLDGGVAMSYRYDPAGNLVAMHDPSGTTTYRYNRVRKITGITYPGNLDIACTYDACGNMTALRYPDGFQVSYRYDVRNRPTQITFGCHSVEIHYDGAGNIITELRSNGTRSRYSYDARHRMTSVQHAKGDESFSSHTCFRDPAGNIHEEAGTQQLPENFSPLPVSASYTPINQVETWNGDRYRYDRDGNLTAIGGGRSFSAGYDAFSHLVDLNTGGRHLQFMYNGRGQRIRKAGDGIFTHYLHGPTGDLLAETDEKGSVGSCFVLCHGRLLAMVRQGKTYFYHTDTRGHIISMTDEHGSVAASYAYDPYGNIAATHGPLADEQPFTFCGLYGVMRESGGLYFMKRRYYDSVTGRFIQKDPIGIAGGMNLYSYAGNNPVTYTDPEGLVAPILAAGLILFAWAGAAISMSQNRSYNTINNALSGVNEYIADPHAPGAYNQFMEKITNLGNIPEAIKEDIFEGQRALWDKFLSLHPASWETYWGEYGPANVYSGIKAMYDTITGEWLDAGRNWLETIPDWPGQLANGLNNWYDAYFGDEKKCK